MASPIKQLCPGCNKTLPVENFGWSRKKSRPTKYCKACHGDPSISRRMNNESTAEMILYYSPIRSLMEHINEAQAEAVKNGLAVDRPIPSLGDVWVGEMTEEAYRAIVKALIKKAESGDVNASKLLLEERHRRLGEPTPGSVEESFEELFKLSPLKPGMDTE
jgi:hypothetical protein